jgi:single-strand DNA-binding protein
MTSFNQCVFVGNVGPAPELKKATDGSSYIRFRLAVETDFRKESPEPPMWLTVVAWRNLAEQVAKVVRKGSLVLVSGRLAMRTFTNGDNEPRTVLEIVAHTIQVLPTGTKRGEESQAEDSADSIATTADQALNHTQVHARAHLASAHAKKRGE